MNYLELLEHKEETLKGKLGDERAQKREITTKLRKEIIILEHRLEKKQEVSEIRERIIDLFNQFNTWT